MSLVKDLLELQIGLGKRNLDKRKEVIIKKLMVSPCREFRISENLKSSSNCFTFMHAGRLFRQVIVGRNKGIIIIIVIKQRLHHLFFTVILCSSAYPPSTAKGKFSQNLQKLFTFPCNFKCDNLEIWSTDSATITESLFPKGSKL